MKNIEKQVLIATRLFNVKYHNDDLEAFPNGYYMCDDEEFEFPFDLKDWEFDSNWNWIMECIGRIARNENKTISNVLHYLTININFNSVDELFESVYNYLIEK